MFYLASLSIAVAFLLETSVLGNAFSYYFNLPRWAAVMPLIAVASISGGIRMSPKIDNRTLFLIISLGSFFSMDFAFGPTHVLYSIKIVILLSFFVMTARSKEILALSAKHILLVFNVALILTALNFLLPGHLLAEPSFLQELRRFDTGDGGREFYSMYNFGGLILTGDNYATLSGFTFPRYAGYFTEPAVYMFSYLSIITIVAASSGLGKVEKIFLGVNMLVTFSLSAMAVAFLFLCGKIWQVGMRWNAIVLFFAISFAIIPLAFIFVDALQSTQVQQKLGGSGNLSQSIWLTGLQEATLAGASSFNARIGHFDIENINVLSLLMAFVLFGFVFIYFIMEGLKFTFSPNELNLLSFTAIFLVLVFILKAPNHTMFNWFAIATLYFFCNTENIPSKLRKAKC